MPMVSSKTLIDHLSFVNLQILLKMPVNSREEETKSIVADSMPGNILESSFHSSFEHDQHLEPVVYNIDTES
jgi:hypothetical protein